MADQSISGNNGNKVEKVSGFPKFFGSPLRSPSSDSDKPKRSSSNPWKRITSFGRRKNPGDPPTESRTSTKADTESLSQPSHVLQPLEEKIKEEADPTAELKDSSPEIDKKKDDLPSKVEHIVEKPNEEPKEKANESKEEAKESLAEVVKDVVIVPKHEPLALDEQHEETHEGSIETETKKPVGGVEDLKAIQSPETTEETAKEEEEIEKEDNCVSSLAQGLQVFCAPRK